VGNLEEEKKIQIFGQYSYEYHGTKEEKVKNEMIDQLKYNLLVYETLLKFVENINMCSSLLIKNKQAKSGIAFIRKYTRGT